MFLLRGMNHMANYVGLKTKSFFNELFGDFSDNTLNILCMVLLFAVDLPIIFFISENYSPDSLKAKSMVLILDVVEFCFCIIFSILTVAMSKINHRVAYYTRAVALSFSITTIALAVFIILICLLP